MPLSHQHHFHFVGGGVPLEVAGNGEDGVIGHARPSTGWAYREARIDVLLNRQWFIGTRLVIDLFPIPLKKEMPTSFTWFNQIGSAWDKMLVPYYFQFL